MVVYEPRHNKLICQGNKYDDEDAEKLARLLRMKELKVVYKGDERQRHLKELCRAYENLVQDSTRAQNRLKAIYRSCAIVCPPPRCLSANTTCRMVGQIAG
ncbi:MAG: transposase [Acidobacteria bacterium]|nr:transposase [Acidobacteriota bacterium]